MTRTPRRRAALTLAAALVAGAALAGCGGGGAPAAGGFDPGDAADVAADPDASVEDILAAGRATRVGATGTGEVLVSYLVESDDDEGPQASAWALYDDGARIAQGRGVRVSEQSASPDTWSTPVGVLLRPDWTAPRWELVRADGSVEPVAASPEPTPTRPGDLALDQLRFFRPADATVHRYAERRPDDRRALDVTVDARGGVWALVDRSGQRVDVLHSADGAAPWTTTSLDLPARGGYPDRVEVVGDEVVVPVIGGGAGDRLVDLRHRPVADTSGPWARAELDGLDTRDFYGASVETLPDGALVVSDQVAWVGGLDGGWAPLALPEAPRATYLGVAGDLLLAATGDGTGLEVSADGGRTWASWTR